MSKRFVPKRGTRGTAEYLYFELSLALGPQQIGVTGDNRYETLYGRGWLMVVDSETEELQMYQQDAVGEWTRITVGLPPIFDAPIPAGAKRFTFAFDQSARAIVVYENDIGQILVTRWNGSAYIQNVTFNGHDPTILMDATVADPRGWPTTAADGWSVGDSYFAGIRVFFNWLPDASLRDNPVEDSDVVLFYLSADRTQVYARTQRELYGTPLLIHTFAEPVVLDRVVALFGRYQLLVSDEAGDQLPEMLISNPYLGDFIINPASDEAAVTIIEPVLARLDFMILRSYADDAATTTIAPELARIDVVIAQSASEEAASTSMQPELVRVDVMIAETSGDDAATTSITAEDARVDTLIVRVDAAHAATTSITPEAIRVQIV